jgi:LPXTG-site transpeptidase (sortase) family protein
LIAGSSVKVTYFYGFNETDLDSATNLGVSDSTTPPTVTDISPANGPTAGGTLVTINGTNLTGGAFTFGGTAAICTVNAAGTVATCATPAHIAGLVDVVVVTTPGGTASLVGSYTFSDPSPAVSVSDTSVPATGSVAAVAVPSTGFAPNRLTVLSPQTVSYADLGDLWLEVPRLGVQMPIVGIPQVNGKWDVSWLGSDAGWLNGSAFPTWNGNSVIAGHVTDVSGKAGPFAAVNTLWYGDKVIIHAWGAQFVYEVRNVLQVGPGNTAAMMKHEDSPWVTLVTCRGYDTASNSYLYRVLVRAVLVEVK